MKAGRFNRHRFADRMLIAALIIRGPGDEFRLSGRFCQRQRQVLLKMLLSESVTVCTVKVICAAPLPVQGLTAADTLRSGRFGSGPLSVSSILQKPLPTFFTTTPVPASVIPLRQFMKV